MRYNTYTCHPPTHPPTSLTQYRVYEAVDVMNLSHWPHQDTFEAERVGSQGWDVALSLSWNQNR